MLETLNASHKMRRNNQIEARQGQMRKNIPRLTCRARPQIERKAESPECDKIRNLVQSLEAEIRALYREQNRLFSERDNAIRRIQDLDREIAKVESEVLPFRVKPPTPPEAILMALLLDKLRRLKAQKGALQDRVRAINDRELVAIQDRVDDKVILQNRQKRDLARLGCSPF